MPRRAALVLTQSSHPTLSLPPLGCNCPTNLKPAAVSSLSRLQITRSRSFFRRKTDETFFSHKLRQFIFAGAYCLKINEITEDFGRRRNSRRLVLDHVVPILGAAY